MTFKAKKPRTGTGYFLPTLSICLAFFGLVALSDGQGCLDGNCTPRATTWGHYEPQWRRWPGATTYQGYRKPIPAVSVPEPKVPDAINETRSSEVTRSDRPLDPEDMPNMPPPVVPGAEGEDPFSNTVDESDIPAPEMGVGAGGDMGAGGGGFQPPNAEAIPEPAQAGGGMFDALPGNEPPAPAGDNELFPNPAGGGGDGGNDDNSGDIFGDDFNLDSRSKSSSGDKVVTRPIPTKMLKPAEVAKKETLNSEFSYADLTLENSKSDQPIDSGVRTVSFEQVEQAEMPKLAEASNVSVIPVGQNAGSFDATATSIATRNPLRNRPRLRTASSATAPPSVKPEDRAISSGSTKTTPVTQRFETQVLDNAMPNLDDIGRQPARTISSEVAKPTELEAVIEMPKLVEAEAVKLQKLPQPSSRSLVASARRPLRETLRKNPLR